MEYRFPRLFSIILSIVCLLGTTLWGSDVGRPGSVKNKGLLDEELNLPSRDRQAFKYEDHITPFSIPARPAVPTEAAISGVKRIGVGKDYTTMAAAITDLNTNGVTGPVTFLLSDTSYTETGLLVLPIVGSSTTNTVSMKPDSNVNSVWVTFTNNSTYGGGLVLAGVSNFILDGTKKNGTVGVRNMIVRFDPSQTFPTSSSDAPIRIREGCWNVWVRNCKIYSMYKSDLSTARPGISLTTTSGPNYRITISNNLITSASYGIRSVGGVDLDSGITIMDNEIGSAFGTTFEGQKNNIQLSGIYVEWSNGTIIKGNKVRGVMRNITATSARTTGIQNNWGNNAFIAENHVDSVISTGSGTGADLRVYGIRSAGITPGLFGSGYPYPTNNRVVNNSVTNVRAVTAGNLDIGIEMNPGEGDYVYHNSVYHEGGGVTSSTCLQLSGDNAVSGMFDVRNNAFVNKRTNSATRGIYRVFNNSGDNDITKADNNVLYSVDVISNLGDGPTLAAWTAAYGFDEHSSDNDPAFISAGNLHLTAGISAAEGLGDTSVDVANDYDGDTRSTTAPDVGFDEAAATALDKDARPVSVTRLPTTGLPISVSATPKAVVKNNTPFSVAAFNVNMVVRDENNNVVTGGGTFSTSVTLGAWESKEISGFTAFTPTTNGPYKITVITQLSGDQVPKNDTLVFSAPIVPKVSVSASGYNTCFEDSVGKFGWSGTDDFVLSNSFTKLGGPYNGASTYSWVTESPGDPDIYTEGGYANQVLSPFFDLSALSGNVYISFFHSLRTEPSWDRSIFQYSTDGGLTWKLVGALDDTNGINWYSTRVYKNALSGVDGGTCLDISTWNALVGVPVPAPGWTSNGKNPDGTGCDFPNTGPYGWVYQQIKFNAVAGNSFVRFRYLAFSDAVASEEGWAFDCFKIGSTGATFSGSISGQKYLDVNGNGANDSEPAEVGVQVEQKYFGVHVAYDTTDASGNYSFNVTLPGTYRISVKKAGFAVTYPIGGVHEFDHPADSSSISGKNFGNYEGGVSGKKYTDLNDNGTNDTEPGLAGWTIALYKDSCSGPLYGSATTDANGNYSITAVPGTYCVKEVGKTGWRQTAPAGETHTVTVSGNSGSTTALVTGKDFGNFEFARIRVELTVDLNGNGIKDAGDVLPLPSGENATFTLSKNGVAVKSVQIGNGTAAYTFDSLNQGIYRIQETVVPAGWMQTAGGILGTFTRVVSVGSIKDTVKYLNFALNTILGQKFRDVDSNGVKDAGDPGIKGWGIKLTRVFGTDTTSSQTLTDSLGNYIFTDLGPGKYTVAELPQAGWTRTFPAAPGTYTITANGAKQLSVHINRNFGNFCPSDCVVGVIDENIIPTEYALRQNYPNPFNPQTNIVFDIPENSFVQLKVFNVIGQEVVTLVNEFKQVGRYTIALDAAQLPSGVYFYKLDAQGATLSKEPFIDIKKMLLVR